MANFKSLGMAGARKACAATSKALRKLFRRPSPAGDDAAPATSSPTQSETQADRGSRRHRIASSSSSGTSTSTMTTTTTAAGDGVGGGDTAIAAAAPPSKQHELQKESQPLNVAAKDELLATTNGPDDVATAIQRLTLEGGEGLEVRASHPTAQEDESLETVAEKKKHLKFIGEALDMVSNEPQPVAMNPCCVE